MAAIVNKFFTEKDYVVCPNPKWPNCGCKCAMKGGSIAHGPVCNDSNDKWAQVNGKWTKVGKCDFNKECQEKRLHNTGCKDWGDWDAVTIKKRNLNFLGKGVIASLILLFIAIAVIKMKN